MVGGVDGVTVRKRVVCHLKFMLYEPLMRKVMNKTITIDNLVGKQL
jgi:hypothetical protein